MPSPCPAPPDVTVSHCALLDAVHAQFGDVVTATLADVPPAPTLIDSGDRLKKQATPA